jgi:hypothetical protein
MCGCLVWMPGVDAWCGCLVQKLSGGSGSAHCVTVMKTIVDYSRSSKIFVWWALTNTCETARFLEYPLKVGLWIRVYMGRATGPHLFHRALSFYRLPDLRPLSPSRLHSICNAVELSCYSTALRCHVCNSVALRLPTSCMCLPHSLRLRSLPYPHYRVFRWSVFKRDSLGFFKIPLGWCNDLSFKIPAA